MLSLASPLPVTASTPQVDQNLPYPVLPCPPIAVFSARFALNPPAVSLSHPAELSRAGALTAAGPLSVLYEIDPAVWKPEYPVIVLSRVHEGLLSEEDRDQLWDRFGVPVFEYLLDAAGQIVAEECEAHEGLHLRRGVWDEVPGTLTREPCPCGKTTPRLLTLEGIIERSLAVSTLTQEWRNWQTHQT